MADPVKADDFLFTRKLELQVREADSAKMQDKRFLIPTIATKMPELFNECLFNDLSLDLSPNDCMQIKLLPISLLAEIQDKMTKNRFHTKS